MHIFQNPNFFIVILQFTLLELFLSLIGPDGIRRHVVIDIYIIRPPEISSPYIFEASNYVLLQGGGVLLYSLVMEGALSGEVVKIALISCGFYVHL